VFLRELEPCVAPPATLGSSWCMHTSPTHHPSSVLCLLCMMCMCCLHCSLICFDLLHRVQKHCGVLARAGTLRCTTGNACSQVVHAHQPHMPSTFSAVPAVHVSQALSSIGFICDCPRPPACACHTTSPSPSRCAALAFHANCAACVAAIGSCAVHVLGAVNQIMPVCRGAILRLLHSCMVSYCCRLRLSARTRWWFGAQAALSLSQCMHSTSECAWSGLVPSTLTPSGCLGTHSS
jgi:hypothetical protein